MKLNESQTKETHTKTHKLNFWKAMTQCDCKFYMIFCFGIKKQWYWGLC